MIFGIFFFFANSRACFYFFLALVCHAVLLVWSKGAVADCYPSSSAATGGISSDSFIIQFGLPCLNRPAQPDPSFFVADPNAPLRGQRRDPLQPAVVPDYSPVDQLTGQAFQSGQGAPAVFQGSVVSTPGFWTGVQTSNVKGDRRAEFRDSTGVVKSFP